MKLKKKAALAAISMVVSSALSSTLSAEDMANLTVEELRIEKAESTLGTLPEPLSMIISVFEEQIAKASSYTTMTQVVLRHADNLWRESVEYFQTTENYDDRSLYWARLQMTKAMRQTKQFASLLPDQQAKLLWTLELESRGTRDIRFDKNTQKKIIVTGFDPFFLDRNIGQSNPSGATALAFDDLVISQDGISAEIETVILPVRFADFDQGMVEAMLAPYFKRGDVDMVATVSMGREAFDLERFPGLRRSAKAPDNLNVYTGASAENPMVPSYNGKPLEGPEFVEFSLPAEVMVKASGKHKINDNHEVQTTERTYDAKSLAELAGKTSVQGSGGGYLSNEISYRTILLRNTYQPLLPVGHIHTPKYKEFDKSLVKSIVDQIQQMLTLATPKI